jgi:hypothetical protein
MSQIHKFYLIEFLKTQKFFTPIMILFLQLHRFSYTEIFGLYAIQAFVEFIMVIPSGIYADQLGKKAVLIISRAILDPSLRAIARFSLVSFAL